MLSFLCFLIGTVFAFCAAVGADFGPDRLIEWALTLYGAGWTLSHLPSGWPGITINRQPPPA